ncbi:hypothetical protein NGA35_14300 [Pseudomonas stutzeri]|nr:hypothetical protein [Stutzerimonas stutzeri]
MLTIPKTLPALAGAALLALLGQAWAAEPAMVKDGMLVDARGMTLYTFDKDSPGRSLCNDTCAINWPPLVATADAEGGGQWSVLQRDDGSWQWAYAGRPLYTFVQDRQPGDTLGDGRMGAWRVARP